MSDTPDEAPDIGGFGGGVISMARSCISGVKLVNQGTWTMEDLENWLNACVTNDAKSMKTTLEKSTNQILERTK